MAKQKKTTKSKKKSEKPEEKVLLEGDVKTEKSCSTCYFRTLSALNENSWCKRHREFIKTLKRKRILTETQLYCKVWCPNLE